MGHITSEPQFPHHVLMSLMHKKIETCVPWVPAAFILGMGKKSSHKVLAILAVLEKLS